VAKKSRKTSRAPVLILVLLVFGIIIVIGVYQSQPQNVIYEAKDYFEVSGSVLGENVTLVLTNSSVRVLYVMEVTIKAVKGDANNVVIMSWAGGQAVEIGNIPKGTTVTRIISSSSYMAGGGYLSKRDATGFPVKIRVRSTETFAESPKDQIIFYLPP